VGLFEREYRIVPPFNVYYPSIEDAGAEQQAYYRWFLKRLNRGETPDVQGNLSYIFVLAYSTINEFIRTRRYAKLAKWFDLLRMGYAQTTKVSSYLNAWQGDAALLIGDFEESWRWHRQTRIDFDLVINVRRRCPSSELFAKDLLALLGNDHGLTETGRARMSAVQLAADRLLNERHRADGLNVVDSFCERHAWRELHDIELDRMADDLDYLVTSRKLKNARDRQPRHQQVEHMLFSGALMDYVTDREVVRLDDGSKMALSFTSRGMNPSVSFVSPSPAIGLALKATCKQLLREAENLVREEAGLPRVGQGWIGETVLFHLLRDSFPTVKVLQHARPEWLAPQHLDVYLPEYNIAFEYQGAQHLGPVDYFGGESAFIAQQNRDKRKKKLCKKYGCFLHEVFQGYDPQELVQRAHAMMCEQSGQA